MADPEPTKTKDQAGYGLGTQAQHCGNCSMIRMVPPDFECYHCTLVRGLIDPKMRCRYWAKGRGDVEDEGESALSRLERLVPLGGPLARLHLAAPAAWPSGTPYKQSFLPAPRDNPGNVVQTAPGAKPVAPIAYGQLRQEPSQTVSASPPLPPKVPLPTPQELRAFAKTLKNDGAPHIELDYHITAARTHVLVAADKLTPPGESAQSALMSLRSAQMAIQDEWRRRVLASYPNLAMVFSPAVPPAEQSSARDQYNAHQAAGQAMKEAAERVAEFIDRIRRNYFGHAGMEPQTAGGGLAGQPTARL